MKLSKESPASRLSMLLICLLTLLSIQLTSCNSSSISDAIDTINVDRKTIDYSKLGVNAFFNDGRFGTISAQGLEIRDSLRLPYVRILFDWNDGVQSGPGAQLNLGFYDSIVSSLPNGVQALAVITGIPTWMHDSKNWSGGNPRATFVNTFFKSLVKRYANNQALTAWELWNEPNDIGNPDNTIMGIQDSPVNYVEMLALARNIIDQYSPGKLLLNGATTAINQNYSETLDYNRGVRDAGALSFVDVWAIHYYGKQYENVTRNGGVRDFLNGLGKSIWVTESGAQGVNSQLAYGETTWPFLIDKIPAIERIYIYQFAEATPADTTYGLRNLTPGVMLSDLYVKLRDR